LKYFSKFVQHLSILDRISLARSSKYFAQVLTDKKLLQINVVGESDNLTHNDEPLHSVLFGKSQWMVRPKMKEGIVSYSYDMVCADCGWKGNIGQREWYRHCATRFR
jgi:hypothetical protein